MSKTTIIVEGLPVAIERLDENDFVSITDIARRRNENKPADSISTWLRSPQTLLYLEAWEELHNPNFKLAQMSEFRLLTQSNRFSITPKKYIEETGFKTGTARRRHLGTRRNRTRVLHLG